jgi:DNA topoisomerase-1
MSSTDEEEFDMDDEVLPKKKKNGNDEAVPKKKKKRPVKAEEDGEINDDDDYDDDVPLKQLKKKRKNKEKDSKKRKPDKVVSGPIKKKKKTEDVKPDKPKSDDTAMKKTAVKALKKLDKAERLQYAMQSFLWWDSVEPPEGCQWRTMEHSGVSFPEEYIPHGIKMKYDGKDVDLTPAQEEAATFFAAMDPEGMHLGDPKTAKIFIKNYFADFLEVLGKKHIIKVGTFAVYLRVIAKALSANIILFL